MVPETQARDPRVYFAAERTLLAWIRTGVTVMGLGFVVARFGLFMAVVSDTHDMGLDTRLSSDVLGPALVLLGAAVTLGAFLNHHLFVRSLPPQDIPSRALPWLTSVLTVAIAAAGLLLSIYLALGRHD